MRRTRFCKKCIRELPAGGADELCARCFAKAMGSKGGRKSAKARSKKFTNLPPGIAVKWSPVNQAYLVMWHSSVLRVLNTRGEVEDYLRDLRRGV